MTTPFFAAVAARQAQTNSMLCIGLDTDLQRVPACMQHLQDPLLAFNQAIIDATADLACCYKPQIAYYASQKAEAQLEETIAYLHERQLPVLLDAKRGDIGSTAKHYAREAFERYGADAVTVNPYMGQDSLTPYLEYQDKGVFILCRTSNPGGADIQNLKLESGQRVYEHIAEQAAGAWNTHGNIGLVMGATQPQELARIRELTGDMPFLVPGVGAQGGDVGALMSAGQGGMLIINSSRAIIYASDGDDFADAAQQAAAKTVAEINRHRPA
ncbi:MAG: orotidine-5'-phosphate decarboxylase [Candidatus Azotimanducaceae bacterium]|jgi:orotidine-5'-phosphate decarboxylase